MKLIVLLILLLASKVYGITLATEENPPLNYSTDNGKSLSGLSTEVLKEAGKRAGVDLAFGYFPWNRAYQMAQHDRNTCVYSAVRTEIREKLFKWIGPLSQNTWILFARADRPIALKTLEDAKKYKVGGYQGDSKAIYLKQQGFVLDEAGNEEQNINKLKLGRIDLWIATSLTGPWIANNYGVKIKPVLKVKDVEVFAACNLEMPDSDVKKINEAIKSIKADGSYKNIVRAYR
jgi:polar amino acid transport system substrate-binding protein